ncbi:universal stress protein [Coralliovum pocilloporae]|uniref:universal stress protein n=1 Tax=Coralliovum pocilloporae TaxID=3066369 RepID=UPI0033077836
MIYKIIVPVRGDGKGDNVLAHVAALTKRHRAHVVVTHCRARSEDLLPFGVPIPKFFREQIVEKAQDVADQVEEQLKKEFTELTEAFGLTVTDQPTGKEATATWVEEQGRQVEVIRHHGRLADLIAVAQPDRDRNLGTNTLKAALFHTGTPVMMCPQAETPPKDLGRHVAIGWNGSMEASRAVAMTIGLITMADKVTIFAGQNQIGGASADDLLKYLALRNIEAEIVPFSPKRNAGRALLDECGNHGVDLLIMGAYGDSHERETLFGGNTQAVVDKAKMPVVFVH